MSDIDIKNIIEESIGIELKEAGFIYKGYHDMMWEFRQRRAPFLSIYFQQYRFGSNLIRLCVVNMYNASLNTASMKRLDLQKTENGFGGFLYYSNEEELTKLINEMFLYAKNELIPRLEEDYYYKKSFNDEDLNRLLFLKHSEYYEEYKSQEDDNFSISKGLDINQLFSYVENRLDYINCLKNEKANDEILKLAAVMGTALEIEFSGAWDLVNLNGEKKVIIKNIKSEIVSYYILDELLKVYRGEKTIEMIKFIFDYMMKTKL